MKLIGKKDNEIVFSGEIENGVANAIRRYIGHIPTVAIDEVEIIKNDSPLYDETVAHRLGLVPIVMEGITEKKIPKAKLSSKGEGMVYSGDLKGVKVAFDKIPITHLGKDQEMEVEATLNFGIGEHHSKYSPGTMSFRNVAEITVDKEFLEGIKKILPEAEVKEKGNKIVVYDNGRKEVLDVVEGIAEMEDKKAETEFKDELVVNIESFGQMKPEMIFKKAIGELKKNLEKVSKNLS